MTNDNRVPAGVPTGGEFATGAKRENDDLSEYGFDADAPNCPRHGGTWGDDETCPACTTEDGMVRPLDDTTNRFAMMAQLSEYGEYADWNGFTGIGEKGWGEDLYAVSKVITQDGESGDVFFNGETGFLGGEPDSWAVSVPVHSKSGRMTSVAASLYHDNFLEGTNGDVRGMEAAVRYLQVLRETETELKAMREEFKMGFRG